MKYLIEIYDWVEENSVSLIVVGLLSVMVGFVIFLYAQPYEPYYISGLVVGKEYSASKTETGVGVGYNQNGNPTTIVTTNTEPEKWTVVMSVRMNIKPTE